MKRSMLLLVPLALSLVVAPPVFSHCQIPCGIYDDALRFTLFEEHLTTMAKSMKLIEELAQDPKANANQLVRWVQNKEDHAEQFRAIVTEYFLTQRIKPVEGDDATAKAAYVKQVTLLHEMLVYSMKAKQTTDQAHIEKLRALVADFRTAYLGPDA